MRGDAAPAGRTAHQLNPLLLAGVTQDFAFDALETAQRDGGRGPAKDAQGGRRFTAQMM